MWVNQGNEARNKLKKHNATEGWCYYTKRVAIKEK